MNILSNQANEPVTAPESKAVSSNTADIRRRRVLVNSLRVLPIVILYLNNICHSRCGSCEIWKNNELLKNAPERHMTDSLLEELKQQKGKSTKP